MPALRFLITHSSECNFNCIYCHSETFPKYLYEKSEEKMINPSLLYKIFKKLERKGFDKMIISGGEPLLKVDEALSYLQKFKRVRTRLITNGSLLNSKLVKELKKNSLNRLIVNLPTLDEMKYKEITRQSKYTPTKVLNIIISACKLNLSVQINYVVLEKKNDNIQEIKSFFNISKDIGIKHFVIIEMYPPTKRTSMQYNNLMKELIKSLNDPRPCLGGWRYTYKSSVDVVFTRCGSRNREKMYCEDDLYVAPNGMAKFFGFDLKPENLLTSDNIFLS